MPIEIYGTVIFSNESGEIKRVECLTEADYLRELDAGAKWIEGEAKSRNVGVYGIRRGFPSDVPVKSSDLPELHAAAKVLQQYEQKKQEPS